MEGAARPGQGPLLSRHLRRQTDKETVLQISHSPRKPEAPPPGSQDSARAPARGQWHRTRPEANARSRRSGLNHLRKTKEKTEQSNQKEQAKRDRKGTGKEKMKLKQKRKHASGEQHQMLKAPPSRLPEFPLQSTEMEKETAPVGKVMLHVTRGPDQSPGSWPIRGGTAQDTEDCARSCGPAPEDVPGATEPP